MPSPVHREVILPELGLPAETLRLSRWLVQTGGTVVVEDPLVEILGDGVTIAIPAPSSGLLLAQLVKPGDSVHVGQHLGVIERDADLWD